eukprot:CAMPEP_0168516912 /NCGR_PEP_ID=MMETSP0405-20121227/5705_1 /TAXON_ID=498012 /ORGANISM="Trichosphaerium sp, Strain Am-I-7 wt" /LENGTH=149 /DNA_ID=CAMNT_0008536755 /DNA_START=386 /DNA_END=832 /DNA_ORIENTATION=+
MKDVATWNAQPAETKKRREGYFGVQERTVKGFMSLAIAILELLQHLSSTRTLASKFMSNKLTAFKTVSMLTRFYEQIVGPKFNDLNVDNPQKYNFKPQDLLKRIIAITMGFAHEKIFVHMFAEDMDYAHEYMNKALYVVNKHSLLTKEA